MGTLAFVCAMPMEMRPLAKRLDLEKGEVGGVKLRTGTLDGSPSSGFVTGMGPDLASEGIDRLLAAVRPERVVVFGITGAVEDETPIGAVMMPALVIDHATGRTHEHHPPGGEATAGALWTTNIMTPAEELPGLIEQGVIALDMETAAYAQSLRARGRPLVGAPGHQRPRHGRQHRRRGVPASRTRTPRPTGATSPATS